jgi:hypothetical protein
MQGKGKNVRERVAIFGLRICANTPLTTDRIDRYELIRSRAGRRKQLLPLLCESRRISHDAPRKGRGFSRQ